MSSPNFDIAFVAALEHIRSNGHRDGRPNDAQCMVIGITEEQLQNTFDIIEQFHQMASQTNQEGRFLLEDPPFDLYLCHLPDGFTEAYKFGDGNPFRPTPFEDAFHRAEDAGQAQLLKTEIAETMVTEQLLTKAENWPSEVATPNTRDLVSPFRIFPENGGIERRSTLGMSLFEYHHLLTATLLTGPPTYRQQVLDLIKREGQGNRAILGLIKKGQGQVAVEPDYLLPFLEHSSDNMRQQALQLLNTIATETSLDQEQLTELLQDDNQQIRRLAARLSGRQEKPQHRQTGRSR